LLEAQAQVEAPGAIGEGAADLVGRSAPSQPHIERCDAAVEPCDVVLGAGGVLAREEFRLRRPATVPWANYRERAIEQRLLGGAPSGFEDEIGARLARRCRCTVNEIALSRCNVVRLCPRRVPVHPRAFPYD